MQEKVLIKKQKDLIEYKDSEKNDKFPKKKNQQCCCRIKKIDKRYKIFEKNLVTKMLKVRK
jgi:hypothetical protein